MSGRPLLLRLLPPRWRESAIHRLYLAGAARRRELFSGAPLHYAPGVVMDLSPTDVGHAIIALGGVVEARLSRRLVELARRGGLLVDVGANYGYHSLLWAAARPDNSVLALEPSPRNIGPLEANVARNGLAARVISLPLAAGREHADLSFDLGPNDQTGWGGLAAAGANTTTVPCVRLDDLAAERGIARIDALKIDAEGGDAWVLYGAERLLAQRRVGHVFFERNEPRMRALGVSFADLAQFLARLGYVPRQLAADEWYAEAPAP